MHVKCTAIFLEVGDIIFRRCYYYNLRICLHAWNIRGHARVQSNPSEVNACKRLDEQYIVMNWNKEGSAYVFTKSQYICNVLVICLFIYYNTMYLQRFTGHLIPELAVRSPSHRVVNSL